MQTSGTSLNAMPGSVIFAVIQDALKRTLRKWSSWPALCISILHLPLSVVSQRASSLTERPNRLRILFWGVTRKTFKPGSSKITRRISSHTPGSSASFSKKQSSIGRSFAIFSFYAEYLSNVCFVIASLFISYSTPLSTYPPSAPQAFSAHLPSKRLLPRNNI